MRGFSLISEELIIKKYFSGQISEKENTERLTAGVGLLGWCYLRPPLIAPIYKCITAYVCPFFTSLFRSLPLSELHHQSPPFNDLALCINITLDSILLSASTLCPGSASAVSQPSIRLEPRPARPLGQGVFPGCAVPGPAAESGGTQQTPDTVTGEELRKEVRMTDAFPIGTGEQQGCNCNTKKRLPENGQKRTDSRYHLLVQGV